MNFHKAKILLEKINRLYAGMSDDQDNISSIEKDLMLNYVREFYEVFYWEREQQSAPKPKPKATYTPPKPKPIVPPPPPPKPEPVVATPPPPKPEPVKVEPPKPKPISPPPPPKPKPVVEEVRTVVDKVVAPPVKEEKPAPPPPKPEPAKVEPPKAKVVEPKSDVDPESEALFETKKAKELSEKLSLSPIMDLNRAFGLNDRMLYTNELFGGDNNVYKETMAILNSFNSMEQAKVYLIENIAGKYNWTSKGKKKQAKEFIRTVSRKYVK